MIHNALELLGIWRHTSQQGKRSAAERERVVSSTVRYGQRTIGRRARPLNERPDVRLGGMFVERAYGGIGRRASFRY